MNLAGGRGVPEALMTASEVGTGWAFWRIRDALASARITGQTAWASRQKISAPVGPIRRNPVNRSRIAAGSPSASSRSRRRSPRLLPSPPR